MKSANPDLDEALAFDPLAAAEKITGQSYKDSPATALLGLSLSHQQGEMKDALLLLNRDTRFSASYVECLEIFADLGFESLLKGGMGATGNSWRVMWRKGILLFCEGYGGDKRMNSGRIFFNYRGPRDALLGCNNGLAAEDADGTLTWWGSRDIREGFRHFLDSAEARGKFLGEWIHDPYVALADYVSREGGCCYKDVTAGRIALLPEEVRKVVEVRL